MPARSRSSSGGASGLAEDVWYIELLKGEPYPSGGCFAAQIPPTDGEGSGALWPRAATEKKRAVASVHVPVTVSFRSSANDRTRIRPSG